jgi:hypothetical protein
MKDLNVDPLVKEGKGKLVDRGRDYPKLFVYISSDLAKDSAFPFKVGDELNIKIEGDNLVIRKCQK